MYRAELIALCVVLLVAPVANRKQILGGSNRGSSAARGSAGGFQQGGGFQQHQGGGFQNPQGGFHPNQQGGFHPNPQGGFHPQQGGGFHQQSGGFNQGPGFRPNPGGFHPGTGPGSVSRGGQWKTALAAGALGAVGGIVTYELGKAIINSASSPFHVNDRPYYFGEQHYQQKHGYTMCSMPLEQLISQTQASTTTTTQAPSAVEDMNGTTVAPVSSTPSPDQVLANLQFKDGTRPKTITWGCRSGAEVCCGTDCCPAPPPSNTGSFGGSSGGGTSIGLIIFGVLMVMLLLCCCCCLVAYKFMRPAFDSLFSNTSNANNEPNVAYSDANKYPNSYDNYAQPQQQQQTYPMQSYPGAQQQSSGGYPPSQGYTYPSQPPPLQYPSYPPQNY